MDIKIIYEDENVLGINKPAGLLAHRAEKTCKDEKTLVDWILESRPEISNVGDEPKLRPGLVHRLDKDTSGIMIIAKNQNAFEFLKKQFLSREIKKTYLALVKGVFKEKNGVIDSPIGRSKSNPAKRSASKKATGKIREALTEYKVLKTFPGYSLLEVAPQTGRTHQIRVHLNSINHPIVCDSLYAKNSGCLPGLQRQFLHASSIEFSLPDGGRIKLEAELPDDLSDALKYLEECDK